MKKFALCFFFFVMPLALANTTPVIVKVGGYNFAPFVEKDGKEGLVKDLLKKFNKTQNKYRFEFVHTSANRRYRDFKAHKYDVILFEDESWSWKDKGIKYSKTPVIAHGGEIPVAVKGSGRDQSFFETVEGKKIKIVLGYHHRVSDMSTDSVYLAKKGIGLGKSYEENFKELLAKKIDITYLNSFLLNKLFTQDKDLKNRLLLGQKYDIDYALRGLVHPHSPISVSELEKLGMNKVLIAEEKD